MDSCQVARRACHWSRHCGCYVLWRSPTHERVDGVQDVGILYDLLDLLGHVSAHRGTTALEMRPA